MAQDYTGGRTAADLIDFLNEKVGTKIKAKVEPTAVVKLDDPAAFEKTVVQSTILKYFDYFPPLQDKWSISGLLRKFSWSQSNSFFHNYLVVFCSMKFQTS